MAKIRGSYPVQIEKHLLNSDSSRPEDAKIAEKGASAVLFLLSENRDKELSLVLTKRSRLVSQPGDLCSPGGRVAPARDRLISILLLLPGMPLRGWRTWRIIRKKDPETAATTALLASAALRETWEEISLNPLRVKLLGVLKPHRLSVFSRTIYPVCAWTASTSRLKPNREVESIHWIPLSRLMEPTNYAAYSIRSVQTGTGDFPVEKETICYRHSEDGKEEFLWGATLGVTLSFLKTVYGFTPPDRETLPLVEDVFTENYFGGI